MNRSGPTFTYQYAPAAPVAQGISTSRTEVGQIALAFVVLMFGLLFIFSGNTLLFGAAGTTLVASLTPELLAVSAAASFTGFVGHEIAHKLVAQRRGYWAEFRMSAVGLGIALASAYFGVLWGAPGATVVSGMGRGARRDWGLTSLAGPLANLAFGAAFYAAAVAEYMNGAAVFNWLLLLAWINGWFGTFNLLPFGPLDGQKVLGWSRAVWIGAIASTAVLAAVAGLGAFVYGRPIFLR